MFPRSTPCFCVWQGRSQTADWSSVLQSQQQHLFSYNNGCNYLRGEIRNCIAHKTSWQVVVWGQANLLQIYSVNETSRMGSARLEQGFAFASRVFKWELPYVMKSPNKPLLSIPKLSIELWLGSFMFVKLFMYVKLTPCFPVFGKGIYFTAYSNWLFFSVATAKLAIGDALSKAIL